MTDPIHFGRICPYCDQKPELLENSSRLYHGRDYGPVWVCDPCGAWVGCHPGTVNPLGRLANRALREAKSAAHRVFDPLCFQRERLSGLTKNGARRAGYRWLSKELGIEAKNCHIGMFDIADCERVIALCEPFIRALASRRADAQSTSG